MPNFDVYDFCITHTQTDRWLRLEIAGALEPYKITMMEWLLLMSAGQSKKGLTITEAAELLGVSLPQITALTQRLQRHDALQQTTHADDRRSRTLSLTPAGQKLAEETEKSVKSHLPDVLREASHFERYLNMHQNLKSKKSYSQGRSPLPADEN